MKTNIIVFGNNFSIWYILAFVIISWVICVNLFVGCCTENPLNVVNKLLYTCNDIMNGKILSYELNPIGSSIPYRAGFANMAPVSNQRQQTSPPLDPSMWGSPNLTWKQGETKPSAVVEFLNRPQQQLPLKEGELDFLANTKFAPSCCPSAYSNSMGCACLAVGDYNYLINRGGNNVPYSEY